MNLKDCTNGNFTKEDKGGDDSDAYDIYDHSKGSRGILSGWKISGLSFIGAAAVSMLCYTTAAYAASEKCNMRNGQCWTQPVGANANSHHVHIDVSPHLTWSVVDHDNGNVVARGTSGWLGTRKTITGLYGRYTLHLRNAVTGILFGGHGTITNN